MLPLDLHVLSLPLAFILSQDQTLHCILKNISLVRPDTYIILSKELTLLDKFCFLGTCFLYSIYQSFQWTSHFLSRGPFFERGCKGTLYFLISKTFFKNFQKSFKPQKLSRQSFQELMPLQTPVFQMGVQRYDFFPYFQTFRQLFLRNLTPPVLKKRITPWTSHHYGEKENYTFQTRKDTRVLTQKKDDLPAILLHI